MTGVNYVRNQWRQSQVSPGTKAEDRATEAQSRTAEEPGGATQPSDWFIRLEAKGGVRMTTSILASPLSEPIPSLLKKKRVLLVDTSSTKRDLRAETMRKLGMEVDCAADISEARSWWRADLYDLVLINMENEQGHRDKFCDDMRSATPPQQLAFLVGKPEYLADSPNANGGSSIQSNDGQAPQE